MINVDFLEYITEFSKTQNLTKASEALHVSQSALTRAMQKIEAEVGVPLFYRARNKLELNETGKFFVKHAERVLEAEREMRMETLAFHNSLSSVSIGLCAPGPMLKYGTTFFNVFSGKAISTKVDASEALLNGLKNGSYDFIFINEPLESEEITSLFAFTEKLYITVPKTHFVAGMKDGVKFSEIDGQSFLIADKLGIWDGVIQKHLPNSRFFAQNLENLNEIINASTIPGFSTNITIPMHGIKGRIDIPILDPEASVNFYIAFRKKNRSSWEDLARAIIREDRA